MHAVRSVPITTVNSTEHALKIEKIEDEIRSLKEKEAVSRMQWENEKSTIEQKLKDLATLIMKVGALDTRVKLIEDGVENFKNSQQHEYENLVNEISRMKTKIEESYTVNSNASLSRETPYDCHKITKITNEVVKTKTTPPFDMYIHPIHEDIQGFLLI